MTVYVVEKWFDRHTYEGILGVYSAKELALMACDEHRQSGDHHNIYKIYMSDVTGRKPYFVQNY